MTNDRIIKRPPIDDSFYSIAEIGIDQLLDDGLIKDIPILRTLKGIVNTERNIRDYLFTEKIYLFLKQVHNFSDEERNKFNEKFNTSKEKSKIGERLLFIIERIDDLNKSKMLGDAFKAYLNDTITKELLFRLCYAIDKVYTDDLKHLKFIEESKVYDQTIALSLYTAGFLTHTGADWGNLDGGPKDGVDYYKRNELAELFLKHVKLEDYKI
jgi:hypothetical protein